LKKIEDEGHVYRRLIRIKNGKRKHKAVFLTDEGLKLAEKIREMNLDQIEKGK
jgi:predicted transcriptional regulator